MFENWLRSTVFASAIAGPLMLGGCATHSQAIGDPMAFDRARPVMLSFEHVSPKGRVAFVTPYNAQPTRLYAEKSEKSMKATENLRKVVPPTPIFQNVTSDVENRTQPEIVFRNRVLGTDGSAPPGIGSGPKADVATPSEANSETSGQSILSQGSGK